MSWVALTVCNEDGRAVEDEVWFQTEAIYLMHWKETHTELFLSGGHRRFVKEKPREIIGEER